jgi:hypothetical protein
MISFRVRFALPCWCSHTKGDFLFIQSSLLAAKQYPKLIMAKEQETKNPNRHSQWLPQAAFSTLCLVSIINPIEGDLKDQSKEVKWSVSALSISLVFQLRHLRELLAAQRQVPRYSRGWSNGKRNNSVKFNEKPLR